MPGNASPFPDGVFSKKIKLPTALVVDRVGVALLNKHTHSKRRRLGRLSQREAATAAPAVATAGSRATEAEFGHRSGQTGGGEGCVWRCGGEGGVEVDSCNAQIGDSRESNSGPLAPEARIIPLDHYPMYTASCLLLLYNLCVSGTHLSYPLQAKPSEGRLLTERKEKTVQWSHSRFFSLFNGKAESESIELNRTRARSI